MNIRETNHEHSRQNRHASIEQIEKQLADLATLKQKAEAHGAKDFASRTALESLRQHERELQKELRAAKLQARPFFSADAPEPN